jgi:hypothetical protein
MDFPRERVRMPVRRWRPRLNCARALRQVQLLPLIRTSLEAKAADPTGQAERYSFARAIDQSCHPAKKLLTHVLLALDENHSAFRPSSAVSDAQPGSPHRTTLI